MSPFIFSTKHLSELYFCQKALPCFSASGTLRTQPETLLFATPILSTISFNEWPRSLNSIASQRSLTFCFILNRVLSNAIILLGSIIYKGTAQRINCHKDKLRFLRLLMQDMLSTPLTKLLQLELALDFADILSRPVVVPLALRTLEPDEIGLWHNMRQSAHRLSRSVTVGTTRRFAISDILLAEAVGRIRTADLLLHCYPCFPEHGIKGLDCIFDISLEFIRERSRPCQSFGRYNTLSWITPRSRPRAGL